MSEILKAHQLFEEINACRIAEMTGKFPSYANSILYWRTVFLRLTGVFNDTPLLMAFMEFCDDRRGDSEVQTTINYLFERFTRLNDASPTLISPERTFDAPFTALLSVYFRAGEKHTTTNAFRSFVNLLLDRDEYEYINFNACIHENGPSLLLHFFTLGYTDILIKLLKRENTLITLNASNGGNFLDYLLDYKLPEQLIDAKTDPGTQRWTKTVEALFSTPHPIKYHRVFSLVALGLKYLRRTLPIASNQLMVYMNELGYPSQLSETKLCDFIDTSLQKDNGNRIENFLAQVQAWIGKEKTFYCGVTCLFNQLLEHYIWLGRIRYYAQHSRNAQTINLELLEEDIFIDFYCPEWGSALTQAIKYKNYVLLELLIKADINVNARYDETQFCLHVYSH